MIVIETQRKFKRIGKAESRAVLECVDRQLLNTAGR